jgi:hypothetical protein
MSLDGNHRHHARRSLIGRLRDGRPRDRAERERAEQEQDRLLRTCQTCAESVYVLADRCRHCGAELTGPIRVA